MANEKEIRTKIKSVQNTQKITSAMEMVAASKMRKAQDRMQAARPYAEKMRNVIAHMAYAHSEYHHPFLQHREVGRVGYVVVTSDRGLCGGLNINLFKKALGELREWDAKNIGVDICAIGKKGIGFFYPPRRQCRRRGRQSRRYPDHCRFSRRYQGDVRCL